MPPARRRKGWPHHENVWRVDRTLILRLMAVFFWVVIIVISGLAELHTNALAALFVARRSSSAARPWPSMPTPTS